MRSKGMKITWNVVVAYLVLILFYHGLVICEAQDGLGLGLGGDSSGDGDGDGVAAPPPPGLDSCNGVYLSYSFDGREKIYPHVKNASAQAYSFTSILSLINTGSVELKAWQVKVGFQYNELLVSTDGGVLVGESEMPVSVGKNGTIFAGYPMTDLKTAIETAGDTTQIQVQVQIKGTMFGLKKGTPMPKNIKLLNDGYKCPPAKRQGSYMSVCCMRDPKFKVKIIKTRFSPRQYGDLNMVYDVLQAYQNKYFAQVTIDNNSPLGRLDHWNLTWNWMKNEFIYSMKGAYTHKRDPYDCIYGPQGQYYQDFDFSTVMSCSSRPIISDLPREKKDDDKVGKLPYCCKNGTLLPSVMNETESRAIFQLEVFKLPPDIQNKTSITPPQNWNITGVLNPTYKCGPPVRVDPTEFPDPSGLDSTTAAIASWQVTCNITRPKTKAAKCCVSYSAYYADSVIPCNTCACGCGETSRCDANAQALTLPPEALLVPFTNRTATAKAWAHLKKHKLPLKLPCPDNCGVSINWHIDSDYNTGFAARMTLFNWGENIFANWFAAIQMKKAYPGYEKVYSFNGTKLPDLNDIIFMQGLPGLNYLVGEVNGTHPTSPRVPGKQQSVISFSKKHTPHLNIAAGDGFPTKVIFNGEECALPTRLPQRSDGKRRSTLSFLPAIFIAIITFLLLADL
ncbi:COBRA-like protein 10 [Coffea eugenioides]|uniref:COBRA-like protein 10 n=1 Tax=Coffea eugenioides TaxID=49369 RepID=UPI000F609F69|nr:COBRA-like protein 10 [Coffea eugenioides]